MYFIYTSFMEILIGSVIVVIRYHRLSVNLKLVINGLCWRSTSVLNERAKLYFVTPGSAFHVQGPCWSLDLTELFYNLYRVGCYLFFLIIGRFVFNVRLSYKYIELPRCRLRDCHSEWQIIRGPRLKYYTPAFSTCQRQGYFAIL